jgi:hypothetical protein
MKPKLMANTESVDIVKSNGLRRWNIISLMAALTGYWESLASSLPFWGRPLEDCLKVIHTDIVTIWNFNDSTDVSRCHAQQG